MVSRVEKYKKKRRIRKSVLIVAALFLVLTFGTGLNKALADLDVQTLLTNWFNEKQNESVKDIEGAVASETDRLMRGLGEDLEKEMTKAQQDLVNFTKTQKESRIAALQSYAQDLKSSLKIDNSEQEAAILANIDTIVAQAKAQMDGQASELKLLPVPVIPPGEASSPIQTTPAPSNEGKENLPQPTPPVVTPEKDGTGEAAISEKTEQPKAEVKAIEAELVIVDVYSITDWFAMPSVQNVTVEEVKIPNGVFSINSTFSDILMNPKAADAMRSILRGIEKHPHFAEIQYKTIDEMSRICPSLFNETILYMLNKSLVQIQI
ncbi:hypothetical protein [Psychrobacillus sp. FSL K6-1267]|uniref:hypothetical protein n=1 Tax=Psychrobacillus sp. FSL K6-1267 TaxID=2921543 RepID=UPI0030F9D2C7